MKKKNKIILGGIAVCIAIGLWIGNEVNAGNSYKLGDINRDGDITQEDLELLNNYITNQTKLNKTQLKLADVYSDGIIDSKDIVKLNAKIKANEYESGDINQDEKVDNADLELLSNYIAGYNDETDISVVELSVVQKEIADLNEDGVINGKDLMKLNAKVEAAKYQKGDITQDGSVNQEDLDLMRNYIKKKAELTEIQLEIADVNKDGKVTTLDITKLNVIFKANEYEKGDVNLDGKVTQEDIDLLYNYITEQVSLDMIQIEVADLNGDGKLSTRDLNMLNVIFKANEYEKGDVNLDGKVTQEDIDLLYNYITEQVSLDMIQIEVADLNGDGKLSTIDLNMLNAIVKANEYEKGDVNLDGKEDSKEEILPVNNETDNSSEVTIVEEEISEPNKEDVENYNKLGDVNLDGKLTREDIDLLYDYITEKISLNEEQLKNADLTGDGVISTRDLNKLNVIIKANEYEKGDINLDGKVDGTDLDILSNYMVEYNDETGTSSVTLSPIQKEIADLNEDGVINGKDVMMLSRKI